MADNIRMKNIYIMTALVLLAISAVCSAIGLRHPHSSAARLHTGSNHYVAGL
jgi:hypothetical protein